MQIEQDQAIVTLAAYGDQKAPLDDKGFWAWANTLAEKFREALKGVEALTEAQRFGGSKLLRRHVESITHHPVGLPAIADALLHPSPYMGTRDEHESGIGSLLRQLLERQVSIDKLSQPFL